MTVDGMAGHEALAALWPPPVRSVAPRARPHDTYAVGEE
jgi:hypothetical protein